MGYVEEAFVIVIVLCLFFGSILYQVIVEESGIITDKYDEDLRSRKAYYFEINNNTYVEVDVHGYKHHEVGDIYTYRKGNIIRRR